MGRPGKPLYPEPGPCDDGALSFDAGAAFLGVCKRKLTMIIAAGELDTVYEGRKPRVLKRQLIQRLEAQLEHERGLRGTGARTSAE